MNHLGRVMLLTVGLGFFAIVLSFVPRHPVVAAGPPVTQVNVTNTPLPVTGNVNATIIGTPTVNVASAPPFPSSISVTGGPMGVQNAVINGTAAPILSQAADNPALSRFLFTASSGAPFFGTQVPSGKALVIEELNVVCSEPNATFYVTDIRLDVTTNGTQAALSFSSYSSHDCFTS